MENLEDMCQSTFLLHLKAGAQFFARRDYVHADYHCGRAAESIGCITDTQRNALSKFHAYVTLSAQYEQR